jgi:uncharacterized membrane protein YkvA (DUF1232 family)
MFSSFSEFLRNLSPEELAKVTQNFRSKAEKVEKSGGLEVAAAGYRLWSYFRDPCMPHSVKMAAGVALLYFIAPMDAIPDVTPVIGYVDDLAVMSGALAHIARSANAIHDARKFSQLRVVK